jgi:hypothetical protein
MMNRQRVPFSFYLLCDPAAVLFPTISKQPPSGDAFKKGGIHGVLTNQKQSSEIL